MKSVIYCWFVFGVGVVFGSPIIGRDFVIKMGNNTNMSKNMLQLPSNATSIRADITDNFSCEGKSYGYYADVENECQIFHVCLPVEYPDGKALNFRWSFICPEETVFNQEIFTCVRMEDLGIDCKNSEEYYKLNDNFGEMIDSNNITSMSEEMSSEKSKEESTSSLENLEGTTPTNKMEATTKSEKLLSYEMNKLSDDSESQMPMDVESFEKNVETVPASQAYTSKIDKPSEADPTSMFPTYFVHEMVDANKPSIFLPLRKNVGLPPDVIPTDSVPPMETVMVDFQDVLVPATSNDMILNNLYDEIVDDSHGDEM